MKTRTRNIAMYLWTALCLLLTVGCTDVTIITGPKVDDAAEYKEHARRGQAPATTPAMRRRSTDTPQQPLACPRRHPGPICPPKYRR